MMSAAVVIAVLSTLFCGHSLAWEPGDAITDFVVPTLDGELEVHAGGGSHLPLVAVALDTGDAFSLHLWTSDKSLTALLTRAPPSASFLFLTHSGFNMLLFSPGKVIPAAEPPLQHAAAGNATASALWMRHRLRRRARRLGLDTAALGERMRHMRFATLPVPQLEGPLPAVLANWTSPRKLLRARASSPAGPGGITDSGAGSSLPAPIESTRLDAFYGWVPWPLTGVEGELKWAGFDCDWQPADGGRGVGAGAGASAGALELNGSVILVVLTRLPRRTARLRLSGQGGQPWEEGGQQAGERTASLAADIRSQGSGGSGPKGAFPVREEAAGCDYGTILGRAQAAGAVAVVLAAPLGQDLEEMTCSGGEEEEGAEQCGEVRVPATMVPHGTGRRLRRMLAGGGQVHVAFPEKQGPGLFAGIDAEGRLFEPGWLKFPTLMHAVWAAQWEEYRARLQERLRAGAAALVVPVLEEQVMEGEHGVRVTVDVPDPQAVLSSPRMELDMELGCPGTRDEDCPAWDHAVQLFVCCQNASGQLDPSCDPCQTTVWGTKEGTSTSTEGPAASARGANAAAGQGGSTHRSELGWHSSRGGVGCGSTSEESGSGGSREGGGVAGAGGGRGLGEEPGLRRRIGHWVTDVTHSRPLLTSSRCTFTMQSTPWAGRWVASLRLRLHPPPASSAGIASLGLEAASLLPGEARGGSVAEGVGPQPAAAQRAQRGAAAPTGLIAGPRRVQRQEQPGPITLPGAFNLTPPTALEGLAATAAAAVLRDAAGPVQQQDAAHPGWQEQPPAAAQLLPLPFNGGTFDSAYNTRFGTYVFQTPAGLRRAVIVSLITGHGSDENNCAEFCPTSHQFEVNGALHRVEFEEAGSMWGCSDKVLEGVEPNEHGTWTYGRNGWCDGQDVRPWVADITADLAPAGGNNTILYYGLFQGRDPQPLQKPGFIMMQANLVLYRAPAPHRVTGVPTRGVPHHSYPPSRVSVA